jgi:hypothetical protein
MDSPVANNGTEMRFLVLCMCIFWLSWSGLLSIHMGIPWELEIK